MTTTKKSTSRWSVIWKTLAAVLMLLFIVLGCIRLYYKFPHGIIIGQMDLRRASRFFPHVRSEGILLARYVRLSL